MTGAGKPVLAVFDLCETLYAQNTTLGFIRFFLSRHGGRGARMMLGAMYSRRLPVFYALAAIHRFLAIDLFRPTLVRMLKGRSRAELGEAARIYAEEELAPIPVAQTHDRLERHRAAGDRVIIVSNSLDIIVEAVANRMGVEWRASRLGFRGDRCEGRIVDDLTGRKSEVVLGLAADAPVQPVLCAYTDNLSDRDLVQAADQATIIIPARGTRARWGDIDAVFIDL